MSKYRLTEQHPTFKKVDALFAFLEQHGLVIERSYEGLRILDTELDQVFELRDADDGQPIQDVPCTFEFKLVYDKD